MGVDYIRSVNNIYHIRHQPAICPLRQADSLNEGKEFLQIRLQRPTEDRLAIATGIVPVFLFPLLVSL